MPTAVRKKTHSRVVAKAFTQAVNCASLYTLLQKELCTSNVSVYVQGCIKFGNSVTPCGARVYIPNSVEMMDRYVPSGFVDYTIEAEYADSNLLPNQLMTRAEFVMELLEILEQLRSKVSPHLQEIAKEVDLVIKYTQNIYSVSELADISYLEPKKEENQCLIGPGITRKP